ncbi:zinc finger protein ZFMSA12A-like [Uranotaenia lowii]|uniref:zinc finger protein ZFMSA12A-like n=1 Tax=Uranotaenia lowii TaxID=190385 RepID=UPI002478B8DB|nr:zinc finger protein ZFMSA12A-like [Uranotaenia lowii]XP_055610138.1 zinc finger protein ZFMSA12A-like [Uranotaenia lowii]XP_055610148.1 zinc finger protein ZFMSA12A-like [Uranotaenia lowii]
MPCIVPTCASEQFHRGRMRKFPNDAVLADRWLQAIQIGCGIAGIDLPLVGPLSQICDAHFDVADPAVVRGYYQEPSIFCTSEGESTTVVSCRTCLNFFPRKEVLPYMDYLHSVDSFPDVAKFSDLFSSNLSLSNYLCLECSARIEILKTILSCSRQFAESSRTLEQLINKVVEQSLWFSEEGGDATNIEQICSIGKLETPNETIGAGENFLSVQLLEEETKNENTGQEYLDPIFTIVELGDSENEIEPEAESLNNHAQQQNDEMVSRECECQHCGEFFGNLLFLQDHIARWHSKKQRFECDICEKLCLSRYDLKTHRAIHSEERPFQCNLCGKRFKTKKTLSSHQNLLHPKGGSLECWICHQSFENAEDLEVHSAEHNETRIECDVCRKTYKNLHTYRSHRAKHDSRIVFPCPICHKSFKQKHYFEQHLKLHKEELNFGCDICGKSFTCGRYLEIHKKKHSSP